MRMLLPLLGICTISCRDTPEPPKPPPPRVPVGLVGDWIRIAPAHLRGYTLTLRADSSAVGIVPWSNGRLASVVSQK